MRLPSYETIMPCFDQFPAEANLIGRLLAGYGDVELDLCQCIAAVTRDIDGAIKALFSERGEEKRIKLAVTLVRDAYKTADLAEKFDFAIDNMQCCRRLRNRYSHCHWYCTPSEGLNFIDLESVAKLQGEIGLLKARRQPVTIALLTEQEIFFRHVQKCFWHLAEAYKASNGQTFKSSPIWNWPEAIKRPE